MTWGTGKMAEELGALVALDKGAGFHSQAISEPWGTPVPGDLSNRQASDIYTCMKSNTLIYITSKRNLKKLNLTNY